MANYVAAIDIVADCGDKTKKFCQGDSLVGVLPGTLESMIRMGQAIEASPAAKPEKPKSPPIQPKGDK